MLILNRHRFASEPAAMLAGLSYDMDNVTGATEQQTSVSGGLAPKQAGSQRRDQPRPVA